MASGCTGGAGTPAAPTVMAGRGVMMACSQPGLGVGASHRAPSHAWTGPCRSEAHP